MPKDKIIKNRSSKFQVGLAMSGHAITDLYASFIFGLIPVLAVRFNLSLFLVGLLTSVTAISNSLTQPIFGYLSDKYNPRYLLAAGPLFSAIIISLIPVTPNYYIILLMLFLGNLSVSAMHPPTAAMGGLFGGRMKGLSNSLISFSGTFGYAFGSIFIISIVEKLGILFSPIAMIPGIIISAILFKYIDIPVKDKSLKSSFNFFNRIRSMNKYKLLQLVLIFSASYTRDILWIAIITFIPLSFTNAGIKLLNLGFVLTVYYLTGGIGGILAGYFSDKLKNKIILIQAVLLFSAPFVYFTFNTDGILPVVFFIIGGFFSISITPLCIRVSQDIFPANISLASSLVMGASLGSASITMIFLGKAADHIGI
ncbi:MAG: MFS transporter, partial [Actinobacteria bacterium]|nr:MFS transporter [Actinomycetota bacterium]